MAQEDGVSQRGDWQGQNRDTSLATFLDSLNSCFWSYSLEFSPTFYSSLENSVDSRILMTSENDLEDKFIKVELSVFFLLFICLL